VVRHGLGRDAADGRVRLVPPPVGLGGLDLPKACRRHPARGDQPCHVLAVDLAPEALRPPWRVALEVRLAVERLANAVDPSPAERDVERLLPRDARDPRGLLEDADPDLLRAVVVPAQPALERLLVPEAL